MKHLKVFENNPIADIQKLISSEKEEISNFLLDINSRIGENAKVQILKASNMLYCRVGNSGDIIKVSSNFDIIELSLEISELKERMSEIGYEIVNYHMDYLKVSMARTGSLKLLLIFRRPI